MGETNPQKERASCRETRLSKCTCYKESLSVLVFKRYWLHHAVEIDLPIFQACISMCAVSWLVLFIACFWRNDGRQTKAALWTLGVERKSVWTCGDGQFCAGFRCLSSRSLNETSGELLCAMCFCFVLAWAWKIAICAFCLFSLNFKLFTSLLPCRIELMTFEWRENTKVLWKPWFLIGPGLSWIVEYMRQLLCFKRHAFCNFYDCPLLPCFPSLNWFLHRFLSVKVYLFPCKKLADRWASIKEFAFLKCFFVWTCWWLCDLQGSHSGDLSNAKCAWTMAWEIWKIPYRQRCRPNVYQFCSCPNCGATEVFRNDYWFVLLPCCQALPASLPN